MNKKKLQQLRKIKTTKLRQVPKTKYGKAILDNSNFSDYENSTVICLASFGFNVETLNPSNIPKSKNPDLYMLGTFWEMKTLLSANQNTVKTHFRKAIKQANGKVIFDLRYYQQDTAKIEQYIIDLFTTTREMRRAILIKREEKQTIAIDLIK